MKTKLKFEVGHRYLYMIGIHISIYEGRVVEISKGGRIKLAIKNSQDEEYFDWIDADEDYEIVEDLGIATDIISTVFGTDGVIVGDNIDPEFLKKFVIKPGKSTEFDLKIEDKNKITGETSDGYHTFNELYRYRMLYNAAFFNQIASDKKFKGFVGKSHRHSDAELCFGGGWFIVVAELPTGQISNHYEDKYWDLFKVNDFPIMPVTWDGHTPNEAADRLEKYLKGS